MKISMLLYPKLTLLDLIGPLQIWDQWPGTTIELVSATSEPVRSDTVATVLPTHTYETACQTPDILFVPGAAKGSLTAMRNQEMLAYLKDTGAQARWVTSVCTGALLLGAAGLLRGYRATTHWAAVSALKHFGAIPEDARWVIDRNRATGGGVTAGIDFGLALMATIAGEGIARATQLAIEYAPAPPFSSGTPTQARPETLLQVTELFEPYRQLLVATAQSAAGRDPRRSPIPSQRPDCESP